MLLSKTMLADENAIVDAIISEANIVHETCCFGWYEQLKVAVEILVAGEL